MPAQKEKKTEFPIIKPVQKRRISHQVVIQLTNLILDGAFMVGSRLPAERDLAGQLSVNRTSLREALRCMESMGLLQIRPGDGIFVQDYNSHSGLEFIGFLLSNGIGLDKKLLLDLAEVRRIFAVEMIQLAAERIDADALSALDEIVRQYPREASQVRLTGELDFRFFQEIAKASRNKIFLFMFNTIREVFQRVSVLYYVVEGRPELTARLYGELVDALRSKNANRAVALFKKQMEQDDQLLSKFLEERE